MLILALDTTTPSGSLALRRDGATLALGPGRALAPSARLPGDLAALLASHGMTFASVDLFAVASGPGSLTGLRVGVATMQGLAFATGRPMIGVSALDALAASALEAGPLEEGDFVGAWMQAHRGEVFASLHRRAADAGLLETPGLSPVEPPSVGRPDQTLDRWAALVGDGHLVIAGDERADLVERHFGPRARLRVPPLLAGIVASLAEHRATLGRAGPPHAVRPTYVRRPDAEVARDERRRQADEARRG
jgi:tRNA threonylcarbamoyladenosine biosynthesis protein TsaB